MSKLDRIKNNAAEMRAAVATLEIEAKAAKAALKVSSEAMDILRIEIERYQSLLLGTQNEIERIEEKIKIAKKERDELKSRSA